MAHRDFQRRCPRAVALIATVGLVVALIAACGDNDNQEAEADLVIFRPHFGAEPVEAPLVAEAELRFEPGSFEELGASSEATAFLALHRGSYVVGFFESGFELADPRDEDAELELWLIAPGDEGGVADLLSLGSFDPDAPGVHTVPEGFDPAVYSIIDISIEPRDGDTAHSGRSILRAPFEFD